MSKKADRKMSNNFKTLRLLKKILPASHLKFTIGFGLNLVKKNLFRKTNLKLKKLISSFLCGGPRPSRIKVKTHKTTPAPFW